MSPVAPVLPTLARADKPVTRMSPLPFTVLKLVTPDAEAIFKVASVARLVS